MTEFGEKNTLSDLMVSEAMRRQVIRLPQTTSLADCITVLIKYKINALLTTSQDGAPAGVVSKTDIMGAYYAGLSIDTPLAEIMSSPPLFCVPGDSLKAALEKMRSNRIYRLYVINAGTGEIIGALAYPDIVGFLYQYCHECEYSHFGRKRKPGRADTIRRFTVKEVMTHSVKTLVRDESLGRVMEELSAYRFGAMLITEPDQTPCGVISKTDLALAYRHGVAPQTPAETIMTSPVCSCEENELLEEAIHKMIFADVHRLFVHRENPGHIIGVLSLTDAARRRSGSCHACVSTRIKVDDHD